jgi:hypothetical protein
VLKAVSGLQASFSLEAFGVKASMDVKEQSEGAKAAKQLEVIEGAVARAFADLGCADQHKPFVILVDQLEQVWSGDADSNAMVRGLLLAGQHVAGTTYSAALRCVLFLRSDIYDSLVFSEGDKFRGDEMRIDWSADELCEVALTRARVSLEKPTLSDAELWTEIFPSVSCFRPALNAIRATDIHGYSVPATTQTSRLEAANVFQAAGLDITIGYSPYSALLDSLLRSCEIILRQLGRSGLPEDARAQVSEELGRVMNGAAE